MFVPSYLGGSVSSDSALAIAGDTASGFDVAALRREEFPWADRAIYLDHASIGPLPERTRRSLEQYNQVRTEAYRLSGEHLFDVFDRSRALAANLIGAAPLEIALATNTSAGINLAAQAIPLEPGDIILVSQGEFPANVFPWREQSRRGAVLELVPLTAEGWPDEARMLARLEDPRVKILALSLVQFHTGYLADVGRLGAAARATGTWFVLDAIQGLGQVPFDVGATPVDILACGAQKWLLSPWGSGFTYVRSDLIERLAPPAVGWTAFEGTDDFATMTTYPSGWRRDARRFEVITLPFQDFVGMNSSLELLGELGVESIARHLRRLTEPLVAWATERGVPIGSVTGPRGTGIVSLAMADAARVHADLKAAGVVVSLREGMIRVSPHCYNTIDEVGRLIELLDRLV